MRNTNGRSAPVVKISKCPIPNNTPLIKTETLSFIRNNLMPLLFNGSSILSKKPRNKYSSAMGAIIERKIKYCNGVYFINGLGPFGISPQIILIAIVAVKLTAINTIIAVKIVLNINFALTGFILKFNSPFD
jgi:hypothetical protein